MRERLHCWLMDDEIEQIHQSSLEILWEWGMWVSHMRAVEL